MPTNHSVDRPQSVNIEDIMQAVRDEILARNLPGQAKRPLASRSLPPDFYEHLYRAGLAQSELAVKPEIIKSHAPIIGPLLDWIRRQFHQLVIYYFDHITTQQSEINNHVLQALRTLDQSPEEGVSAGRESLAAYKSGFGPHAVEWASMADVFACFRLFLDRDPGEREWDFWSGKLLEQPIRRPELVNLFLNESEYAGPETSHSPGMGGETSAGETGKPDERPH
jgi:hypothetical protein